MDYTIRGELAQIAHLNLSAGENCWANRGALMGLTPEVIWTLKVPGGVGGAMRRSFAGEGALLTYIEAKKNEQQVLLTSNQPGKIMGWDLTEGPVLTTRGSFVAAFGRLVDITAVVAKRARAILFGGTGMFLQKVSGSGTVLIHGAGDFSDFRLEAGQSILVSTGNLAAFSDGVDYSIQTVAGCRRMFFGGEGFFMTKLTGPGRVLLQSLKRGTGIKTTTGM